MVLSDPVALWALPVADPAGVARHAVDTARAGVPGFHTVFLLPEGPLVGLLREVGAEVVVDRFGPAHGARASYAALRRAQRRLRPALVHSHLAHADLVAAAARAPGVRLVTTEHGIAAEDRVYHGTSARSALMAAVHRLRLRRADAFVAVSGATLAAARAKWHLPEAVPAYVVRNGVDPARSAREPEPGLHVLSLARLAPEKRLPLLLDAFAVLAAEHPSARLTLAGDGPLREPLRRRAEEVGLAGRVHLPGHVDPAPLLAEADVLALLSVWENCSYALLDAVAHGLGAVACPVGGNPEQLPPRCLVDPDDPASVARVLAGQGLRPEERPRLPEGWPTVAEMTAATADVYARVLS